MSYLARSRTLLISIFISSHHPHPLAPCASISTHPLHPLVHLFTLLHKQSPVCPVLPTYLTTVSALALALLHLCLCESSQGMCTSNVLFPLIFQFVCHLSTANCLCCPSFTLPPLPCFMDNRPADYKLPAPILLISQSHNLTLVGHAETSYCLHLLLPVDLHVEGQLCACEAVHTRSMLGHSPGLP